MLEPALVAHIKADATLGPLLSDGPTSRIFPHVIPQKIPGSLPQVPCLVYELRSEERQRTYCETGKLLRTAYSIDSYGITFLGAKDLAKAVRDSLIDFAGMLGGIQEVRDISLDGAFSIEDMEPGLYRVEQTYIIWYVED